MGEGWRWAALGRGLFYFGAIVVHGDIEAMVVAGGGCRLRGTEMEWDLRIFKPRVCIYGEGLAGRRGVVSEAGLLRKTTQCHEEEA